MKRERLREDEVEIEIEWFIWSTRDDKRVIHLINIRDVERDEGESERESFWHQLQGQIHHVAAKFRDKRDVIRSAIFRNILERGTKFLLDKTDRINFTSCVKKWTRHDGSHLFRCDLAWHCNVRATIGAWLTIDRLSIITCPKKLILDGHRRDCSSFDCNDEKPLCCTF